MHLPRLLFCLLLGLVALISRVVSGEQVSPRGDVQAGTAPIASTSPTPNVDWQEDRVRSIVDECLAARGLQPAPIGGAPHPDDVAPQSNRLAGTIVGDDLTLTGSWH